MPGRPLRRPKKMTDAQLLRRWKLVLRNPREWGWDRDLKTVQREIANLEKKLRKK